MNKTPVEGAVPRTLAEELTDAGITKLVVSGMCVPSPLSKELAEAFAAKTSPTTITDAAKPPSPLIVIDEQKPFR